MNKKVVFAFSILVIAVVSISSVNAFWFFGGGNEITVNDVKFNIPDGFEEDTNDHESTSTSEKVVYVNDKNEKLSILVKDISSPDVKDVRELDWGAHYGAMVDNEISGKDGLASYEYVPMVWYGYVENGKLVMMDCPYVLDDGTRYDEFLENVII